MSGQGPSPADEAAIAHVRAALADAAAQLAAAGARTEALAEYVPAGRVLLVPRPERLRPLGSVWRLGVLLLAAPQQSEGPVAADASSGFHEPQLFSTGSLTRSHEPGRATFIAASAERRRQLGVAAFRGRFPPGTSVNFDATPLPLDRSLVGSSGVLSVREGAAYVRWRTGDPDAVADFDSYLAERVSLLVTPAEGD